MRNKSILFTLICVWLSSCTTSYFSSHNESGEQSPNVTMKVVKQDKNQQEIEVQEREELDRLDKFAVWVTTQADAYVYIFWVDSNQKKIRLFPNPNYSNKNSFLKSDAIIRVPDNGRWLHVSGNKGIEEIFVLAQKEPLTDPDRMLKYIIESSKGGGVAGERPPDNKGGFTDSGKPNYSKFYFLHR